jgi:hypothetical protein
MEVEVGDYVSIDSSRAAYATAITSESTMSQRSSISSSTDILLKYSRAYLSQTNNDWQHFTNPVIRVHLDVKKSLATDELESVRLRVLWTMESGANAMDVDQGEFIFVRRVSKAA